MRVIERMIMCVKEMELWGMGRYGELGMMVKQRYEEYKSVVLSEKFMAIPLK